MAKKLDNIDLDMIDADRLGYGVQYGRFKADHPFTKEANEPRLAGRKQIKECVKKVYVFNCPTCGEEFTTTNKNRVYCCDKCKIKKNNAFYKAKEEQQ
jgi:ribosomal protein L37AE/L43A